MKKLSLFLVLFFSLSAESFKIDTAKLVVTSHPIEVNPTTEDGEIKNRLEKILNASGWFSSISIEVNQGIVFLSGTTSSQEYKNWAEDLAKNTQNVVAVVNKIEVEPPNFHEITAIRDVFQEQWRSLVRSIPSILTGILILILTWFAAKMGSRLTRKIMIQKLEKSLVIDVAARGIAIFIFLLGVYFVFEINHLTAAAVTIVSGTGILGVILGIAFRDITENFLASLLLSVQHPFRNGDLVEVAGVTGYVEGLTMRVTQLRTSDGHHLQIPNAIVYKSSLRNFTKNHFRRDDFLIEIELDNEMELVEKVILKSLSQDPQILKEPTPMVLIDSFGKSGICLKVYFWIDSYEQTLIKIKSRVLQRTIDALLKAKISLPDTARERFLHTIHQ